MRRENMGRQHVNVVQEKYIALTANGEMVYTHGGFRKLDAITFAEIYLFATPTNAKEKLKLFLSYDGLIITKVYVEIKEDKPIGLYKDVKSVLVDKVVQGLEWLNNHELPNSKTANLYKILGDLHTELTLLQIDHEVNTVNH
jgi:hypothetical protein